MIRCLQSNQIRHKEGKRIVGYLGTLFRNPGRALVVMRDRLFPKDPEIKRMAQWHFGSTPRVYLTDVFSGIESHNISILRAFDRQIDTSLDLHELLCLSAIAVAIQAKRIIEIGTFDGNTALNLAENSAPDALIITVDLPVDWNGQFGLQVSQSERNVTDHSKVGWQFRESVHSKKIRQVFQDSARLDWGQLPGPFDLVFIDGCHHYSYVRMDTDNALKNIRRGGVIVWHDYGEREGISRVVDELADRFMVYALRGTRLAVGIVP